MDLQALFYRNAYLCYEFVGLELFFVHCEPYFMHGAGLWTAGHCKLQVLRAKSKCGPYEFQY